MFLFIKGAYEQKRFLYLNNITKLSQIEIDKYALARLGTARKLCSCRFIIRLISLRTK